MRIKYLLKDNTKENRIQKKREYKRKTDGRFRKRMEPIKIVI